jgi:phosphoglycolate phosphatase
VAAKFDLVIFDLDGTLIDSRLDLANSANAARAFMGMGPIPNETVYSYVGNGAPMLIRRVLGPGASEDDIAKSLEFFIHYYHDHRLDFTVLYPGVRESLDSLAAGGVRMAVLTNKPVRISHLIVEGLNVAHHFGSVYGGNSFPEKKPSPVGILKLMDEFGTAPERTLMVGDSSVDIETARNAKVVACGVTYGFQPETLRATPPDILLDEFDQLVPAVLGS